MAYESLPQKGDKHSSLAKVGLIEKVVTPLLHPVLLKERYSADLRQEQGHKDGWDRSEMLPAGQGGGSGDVEAQPAQDLTEVVGMATDAP